MAYTVSHSFIVEHANGNRGEIKIAGNRFSLELEQRARMIFARRADIRSIDLFRVDNEGARNRVVFIHPGNQDRKPSHAVATITVKPTIAPRARLFNVAWRKVGGLTFVRLGRLSVSFCLTRKAVQS